jgi:hypothetical protein
MIADDVSPTPLNLWNAGIKEFGAPRQESREVIRLNLLVPGKATVTQSGIIFKDQRYDCELAKHPSNNWYVRAGANGIWDVDVVYYPHMCQVIYLSPNPRIGIHRMERCTRMDGNRLNASGLSFWEIDSHFNRLSEKEAESKQAKAQAVADLNAERDEILINAQRRSKEQNNGGSDRSRLRGIKENKKRERDHLRKANLWAELDPVEPDPTVVSRDHTGEDEITLPNHSSKLREAWKNKGG